jgi:apolipoprotein N-acyltransferase
MTAVVAFLLGLLHAASFAPATHWALALAVLAGLFGLLRRAAARGASPAASAGLVAVFGLGWFGAGLSWLYVSMHDYGGMPAPMAAAAVVLFAAYLSAYPALATWLVARFLRGCDAPGQALAMAAAWTVAELARGWVLTGFPWLAIGYAQLDGPIDRLAPVLGVFGLGAVATAAAALAAAALPIGAPAGGPARPASPAASAASAASAAGAAATGAARSRLVCVATASALVLAPLALPRGGWTEPSGRPLEVRLLQGNVPQDMKFQPERTLAAMQDYSTRFLDGRAALTILPETAWTVPWDRTPVSIEQAIAGHVARGHAIAVGLPAFVPDPAGGRPRLANSVLVLQQPADRVAGPLRADRYDKHHLVPFGEFVPWGFRWFVDLMHIPLGDFARGARSQTAIAVADQRIAFNICYEDLFGEEIRLPLLDGAGATVLANVSNIAWFGRSHALPQHLAIARLRSLETGRPMLRATNTGMTGAIDAEGRVIALLEPHTAGALDVRVQGMRGLTPYVRFGNLPVLLGAIALLIAMRFRSRPGGGRAQSR